MNELGLEWEGVTYASAEDQHLVRTLRATPRQRLAWLESALELAWVAGAVQRNSVATEDDEPVGSSSSPDPVPAG